MPNPRPKVKIPAGKPRTELKWKTVPLAEEVPLVPIWPEAGTWLGLSRQGTYDVSARNELPTVRIGSRVLVRTKQLLVMLGLDEAPSKPPTNERPNTKVMAKTATRRK